MTDVLSADGRIIYLRAVRATDAAALRKLYTEASERSRRLRFFAAGSQQQLEEEIERLTRPASGDHGGVLASDGDRVIGVASWERLAEPGKAEFAVLVADDWHGRGVGTLLLEQLAATARRGGIKEIVGEVLAENTGMSRVASGLAPGRPCSCSSFAGRESRPPLRPDGPAVGTFCPGWYSTPTAR